MDVAVSPAEKMASRSKIMKLGADSKGKVSRSCCATQAAGAPSAAGQPVPVDAEPGAMPAHDRVGPDDGEGLGPTVPTPTQQDPEDPIRGPDVGVPPPGQGGELLAEGQGLEDEISPRAHGREERRQEG
jgi:hypothetical protein